VAQQQARKRLIRTGSASDLGIKLQWLSRLVTTARRFSVFRFSLSFTLTPAYVATQVAIAPGTD
jgi:hypothetical protein